MTIKPVADLYLIKYEDGRLYKCARDAEEAVDAIGFGFKVEEFVSLDNHRTTMLHGANGNSPVIPDEVLSADRKVACIRADFDGFDGDRRDIGDCLDEAEQELIVTINKYASVIAAAPQQEA